MQIRLDYNERIDADNLTNSILELYEIESEYRFDVIVNRYIVSLRGTKQISSIFISNPDLLLVYPDFFKDSPVISEIFNNHQYNNYYSLQYNQNEFKKAVNHLLTITKSLYLKEKTLAIL